MPIFGKNGPRRNASAAPPRRAQLKVRSRRSTSFRGYRRPGPGGHAALAGRTFCDGAATAQRLCRRRGRVRGGGGGGGRSGLAASEGAGRARFASGALAGSPGGRGGEPPDYGHVLDEPNAVADPVRAAVLQRLPDRRRPEALARVNGDVEVLATAVLERREVRLRGMARFLAGDVEADHPALAVGDGQLRHLERVRRRKPPVADLARKLDDGPGTQAAVQMVVK